MKNFIFRIGLLGIALLVAGCGGGGNSYQPRELAFTRVGSVMGDWPIGGLVFKTEAEWSTAWDEHIVRFQQRQGASEVPALPDVDFSSSMLIGWSEWVQPCELGVEITRVVEEAMRVRVDYQYPQYSRFRAAEGIACIAEYWSSPHFSFFKIAATTKPVEFVQTSSAPVASVVK